MKTATLFLTCASITLTASLAFADPPARKHRVIKGGMGNCIFSPQILPHDKEDSYVLKTEFTSPEGVWGRCYFPDQIKGFESKGRLSNSLRNEKQYWNQITITSGKEPSRRRYILPLIYNDKTREFDGGQFPLDPKFSPCQVKERDGSCTNVDTVARAIAEDDGKALPITVEVCFRLYITAADNTKQVVDPDRNALVTMDDVQQLVMAEGCANYTAK